LLAEIRDGSFAKKWIEENEKGCPNFLAKRKAEQQHTIEQLGPGLRAMMPFLQPVVAPASPQKLPQPTSNSAVTMWPRPARPHRVEPGES